MIGIGTGIAGPLAATQIGAEGLGDHTADRSLPTGTVTLLLADVEGSTRMWETRPGDDERTEAVTRIWVSDPEEPHVILVGPDGIDEALTVEQLFERLETIEAYRPGDTRARLGQGAHAVSAPGSALHRYSRAVTSGDALTGRDTELAELRRALSGAGKYAGVMIAGAPGVGKTRLARELVGRAAFTGMHTNWIVGTESARPIPLGAFTTTLSSEAMAAVAASAPSVRRVIDSLVGGQGRGRFLIGVDDAHLLDGFSAHVVHHLAQTRQARLVVTLRTGTGPPDAVTALWKDGLLARLDLDPLTEDATRLMVEGVLGGPIDARSAKRFFKLTGGNPLYLQQLIRDQVAADRLRKAAGYWIWDGGVAVSQSMSDLVGSQLDRLPPELAHVVDTLSQCEPLEVDVLAEVVGREQVEAADAMHLITVERTGGTLMARLAHPLFGELRRAAVGELHLSKVRGELARRFYERDDHDAQATVRRALLVLQSDLAPDPKLYLDAARHSMRLLDLDLADRFAAAATALGLVEAVELQAINRFLAGQGGKAEDLLRLLVARGGADRHRWATVLAANLIWMLGRPAEAADVLADLAKGPETDGGARRAVGRGVLRRRGVRHDAPRPSKRPGSHWIPRTCPICPRCWPRWPW